MSAITELRDVALRAAGHGWTVFPLWPGTKIPALHSRRRCPRLGVCSQEHLGWERRATADPDRIRRCWAARAYNVGIATGPSGLVVLDLDVAKPGQVPLPPWNQPGVECGADVFLLLCNEASHLPPLDTYTVATPSGGAHLYYRTPPGTRMRSTVSVSQRAGKLPKQQSGLGWKIDTRAAGGQVLSAGSRIRSRRYQLINEAPVMELPPWLADRLAAHSEHPRSSAQVEPVIAHVRSQSGYAGAALRGEIDRVLAAQEGCRNDTLNAAAYSLGRRVSEGLIAKHLAHDALLAAGTAIGLPRWECEATIQSGLRAGFLVARGVHT